MTYTIATCFTEHQAASLGNVDGYVIDGKKSALGGRSLFDLRCLGLLPSRFQFADQH